MRIYDKKHEPDEDDEIFTIQEWNLTKNLFIFNSDGSGYYMKNGFICKKDEVFSSEPLDATHVIWYSK